MQIKGCERNLKAIIMAGGEGTRLRPLTCDCPKPMLKIMGRPILEYALNLAKDSGISEFGVTLGYLPQPIMDYFGDGNGFDAKIRYFIEKMPLGTAGSVRMAKDFLDERFIVLSGDGVCDFDLQAAMRFHAENHAQATIVLKRHPCPLEYGVMTLNDNFTIRSFHEKPSRCEVFSDLVNTGIYILEPELIDKIDADRPCDFSRDFFPKLMSENIDIYGYIADGYWCDVGDVGAYLRVHRDAMDGKIDLIGMEKCGIATGAVIQTGAEIIKPCHISENAQIRAGARIGPYAWIGRGVCIEGGASVKRSVISDHAHIFEGAQLRGCVVARNATVESHAQLFEESVVGAFSKVGSRALLMQGVKLWPGKSLPEGERPEENIVWGAKRILRFVSGRLQTDDPAQATRFMQGVVAKMKAKEIMLGHAASGVASAMFHAAVAGAMAQGAKVYDVGVYSLPQLRHMQRNMRLSCAALVDENGILPIDQGGSLLPDTVQRDILKSIERRDYAEAFSSVTGSIQRLGDHSLSYIAENAALYSADPICAPRILLLCENFHVLNLAEQSFERAGLKIRIASNREAAFPDADEFCVELSCGGECALISDADGEMNDVLREIMCAWTLIRLGEKRLLLKLNATRAIDALCEKSACHAVYISGDTAVWNAAMAANSPLQFRIQTDGIAASLAFISALTECGLSLKQWRSEMPLVHRSFRRIRIPFEKSGAALKQIYESSHDAQMGGGMRLTGENGWAWLAPDDIQPEMCIMAESMRHETADELCAFYADALEKLIERKDN